MATMYTPLATTTMPPSLASSLSSSFSSTGRGTLLVGVASPSTIEALFSSLRGKNGGKKLIRSWNKTTLLQGDVTQLTTILTRSEWITLLTWNPYLCYHRFLSFLQCLHIAVLMLLEKNGHCICVCIGN